MADQTVSISNFPDKSSGSAERVAFDLLKWMSKVTDADKRAQYLDQYAECLAATKGHRLK